MLSYIISYQETFKGGYLGVVLFFVLSGYLITDLLIHEFENSGKISAKTFYIRRLKRLYPAMLTVLFSSALYMGIFQRNMLNQMRIVFISSLLSFHNWWQISKGGSYFNHLLAEAPFQHFYSLAIEAQYYLVWPIVVYFLFLFTWLTGMNYPVNTIKTGLKLMVSIPIMREATSMYRCWWEPFLRLNSTLTKKSLSYLLCNRVEGIGILLWRNLIVILS